MRLADVFRNEPLRSVWASPAVRARETAEAIAARTRLDVGILEPLREARLRRLEDGHTTRSPSRIQRLCGSG